ncbi:MAG: 1-deoxy-D-xylulose-5-phosphate reductoisomerase [Balneolaceae bacterium]
MRQQKLAVFGSTGSIGTQALEIADQKSGLFTITVLSANNNYRLLAEQANHFRPETVVLCNPSSRKKFETLLSYKPKDLLYGHDMLGKIAASAEYDLLLNSLVGFAGFMSTYEALKQGKRVALANKESLVVGGEILTKLPAFKKGKLIPVDSEHSAMLQCLAGEERSSVRKIIITASGGPFRDHTKAELESVTVDEALKHPNWDMGSKITIDSSTLMNKGLEMIEARWLYDLPIEKIEPVIHPQSIIHSIIEFIDGSSKAQLGPPDMKVPILYALTYPARVEFFNPTLDYTHSISMDFFPVSFDRFPCIKLAVDAAKEGGFAPAVLNAANEVAVERFLKKEIRYIDIPKIIGASLNKIKVQKELTISALQYIDKETREFANTFLK